LSFLLGCELDLLTCLVCTQKIVFLKFCHSSFPDAEFIKPNRTSE
jgi:hypothetical protein